MPQPDSALSQPDVEAAAVPAPDQVRAGGSAPDDGDTLADGAVRHLDPRIIPLDRVMGWVFTAVVVFVLLITNVVLLVAGRGPRWLLVLLPFGSVAVSVAVGWFSYV
ncbi:MAG TPA: hypothetical protein VLD67_09780, partial [Vicinamibacterales bacterium]|nr:hypothetical protein [Vicinamibacterales bacterium]